ncbi:MAG: dTDP-glucose 4,6-dehydratase [Chitinispirillia bacterium]|nr:dTDP-glucose 4,6-dehydratase [Chitinispirillia bacterium]MCL2184120.1 dTDP-glucose 4,6-dehydratase [Chitinispirillia bacterium]MCL2269650.1 dTDP-glucose 4,6-dehydratase [Chitinispirillia bacterium]
MKNILVTGGAGFIGSNFVIHMIKNRSDCRIVNYDLLTYAGNLDNLNEVKNDPRCSFVKGDICDPSAVKKLFDDNNFDAVVHFAAESHVDKSITGPAQFVTTNVLGTQILLQTAKELWENNFNTKRFIHVSTDEVYGTLGETGSFTESTPLAPNSPYSASKAGSDLLARAYFETFGFPSIITRCSNNYGPYQFPEKLIPLMITNALNDKPLPVYGDGQNVRDWLYVQDHCRAIEAVLGRGAPGQVYNIGGNNEKRNIDIVQLILTALGKPYRLIKFVPDRLGHDRRYAIDASKIKSELGWEPSVNFETGIRDTIKWYLANEWWWKKLR